MNAIHILKTWPRFFPPILAGSKTFEVRKDDRGFAVGDDLILVEWDPETCHYGERAVRCAVNYILRDTRFGVQPGFCVMAVSIVQRQVARQDFENYLSQPLAADGARDRT